MKNVLGEWDAEGKACPLDGIGGLDGAVKLVFYDELGHVQTNARGGLGFVAVEGFKDRLDGLGRDATGIVFDDDLEDLRCLMQRDGDKGGTYM